MQRDVTLCRAMYSAWTQGEITRAQQLAVVLVRLTAALSRESHPVPVKYALRVMNLISPQVRLPLVELQSGTKVGIEKVLARIAMEYSGYMIGDVSRPDRYRVQSMEPARAKARFAIVPGRAG